MAQVPWWRGNLPAEMSGFIGHESEVRRLLRLLPEAPLITVIGAGGVGKSRIAVKAAEECRDSYSGGAWLVELSGEHNGDLLAHTVAAALGLCEQSARSQIEVLVEFLADKELLLLLDACEHLLPACRGLAADILAAAPGVRIVATSRQALELPQETLLFVEPFEVPEPGAVTPDANDALRFLLDRAGTAVPALEVGEAELAAAGRICRRLDGIPLALELAAERLRTFSMEQLADQLEARFGALYPEYPDGALLARHQTLQTVIGWSHELCGDEERLLWARLSVFAGNFDVEAVTWVCGDRHLADVRDLLAGLVEKSLLVPVPGGYRQLDPIRDYGRERLARLGDEERLTRRHRYHYLDLARRADADWYGPRQEEWAERLNFSITNLRLALDSDSPSTSLSVELAGTLWVLWFCLGRMREGRHYMRRAIDSAPITDPGLPRLLWADGCVAIAQGELELGRCRVEAALSAALDWGDYAAAGHAQLRLARRSLFAGLTDEVESAVELTREYFRKADVVTVGEPIALVTLAMAATWRGEFAKVVSVLEEVQRLCDARGELWVRACGDYVLSIAQLGLGRLAAATVAARQSLDVKWRLRDTAGVALALDQLAVIAAVEGDGHRTARLQGSGVRLWKTFGLRGFGSKGLSEPRTVAERTARQLLGDDAYDAIFAEGYDDDLDSAMAYALG